MHLIHRQRCAAAAAALLSAASAAGQFAELSRSHLPTSENGTAAAAGDLDGDGDQDVILTSASLPPMVLLNDGQGRFAAPPGRILTWRTTPTSVALGDVDADGDLDAVFGSLRGSASLLLNDGAARFTDVSFTHVPLGPRRTNAVALADVDADGDLDLVLGNGEVGEPEPLGLLLNSGAGRFTDASTLLPPGLRAQTNGFATGDVDADGDVDLIATTHTVKVLYRNDGGRFVDAGAFPDTRASGAGVALADLDGDLDLDVVFANYGRTELFLNDGQGRFTPAHERFGGSFERRTGVVLVDVDRDGDRDAVLSVGVVPGSRRTGQDQLFRNDGRGFFADATAASVPAELDDTVAVVTFDAEGDGDPDLLFVNDWTHRSRLCLNDGAGSFADASTAVLSLGMDRTLATAAGDLDGDGDIDLVLANYWHDSRILRNDGTGLLRECVPCLPVFTERISDAAIGDLDGDGDPDLLLVGPAHLLLFNDGRAGFTDGSGRLPWTSFRPAGIALGDVDRDGDLDVLLANGASASSAMAEQNRLYLNDGRGSFTDVTAARLPALVDLSHDAELVDVDGDGDLDLLVANTHGSLLHLNDGNGTFAQAPAALLPWWIPARVLVTGDLDGDRAVDVVFADDQAVRVVRNDGGGRFTEVTASVLPAPAGARTLALGDVDTDGDLDLLLGVYWQQKRLYVNDGRGRFSDATSRLPRETARTTRVTLADLDEDGDLDAFLGNEIGGADPGSVVYANLTRHLHSPYVPRIGGEYVLDVHCSLLRPRQLDHAVILIAAALQRRVLPPLGVLHLDPATLAPLPVLFPRLEPVVRSRIPVPADRTLLGRALHAQAIIVEADGPRLTNLASDRLSN